MAETTRRKEERQPLSPNNPENAGTFLDIDEFVIEIGQFGKFQKLLTFLYCLLIFAPAYQPLVMAFAGYNPSWRCSASGCHLVRVT